MRVSLCPGAEQPTRVPYVQSVDDILLRLRSSSEKGRYGKMAIFYKRINNKNDVINYT